MKIIEIGDMVNDANIEARIFKYPELVKMKDKLDSFNEAKVDKRLVSDFLNKSLQDDGYINYIKYIKAHKYPLNSLFKNALASNSIAGEQEFQNLMNALKAQGPYNTFLNIANNYVQEAEQEKFNKTEGLTALEETLFVAKETILGRQFDVMDYFLFKTREKTKTIEPQRV